MLTPIADGEPAYSRYEIGHALLVQRVCSKLIASNVLKERDVAVFKNFMGKLFHGVPASIMRRRLTALNLLERRLGHARLVDLIEKTTELWRERHRDLRSLRTSSGYISEPRPRCSCKATPFARAN